MLARVRRALGAVVLTLMMLGFGGCAVERLWQPTPEEIVDRILPSAVQVVLEQQEGRRFRAASGVAIASRAASEGPECFVLTAAHTFSGARGKQVYVIFFGSHEGAGVKVPATVLAQKETEVVDLALLKAQSDQCTPARIRRSPSLGASVWVVAFPLGRRLSLARGVVSQVDGDGRSEHETEARFMVDATVTYGASGAGVFEARTGSLIGIVEGYSTARVSSQGSGSPWYIDVPVPGQTFVTSLRHVRRFLEEAGHADLVGGRAE